MNETYTVKTETKTRFACFVKTPDGMLPLGMCDEKASAIGKLILAMQDIFCEMADNDDDLNMVFGSEEFVYSSDLGYGFRIEGLLKKGSDPVIFMHYLTDDDPVDHDTFRLTGYALVMEVD